MVDYFQILCGIAVVFLSLYYYFTKNFDHWKNLGIPGPRPLPLAGNFKDVLTKTAAIGDFLNQLYEKYKHEPVLGIFLRNRPILVVNDLDLIKDILIKDFSIFASRGLDIYPKAEPLTQQLFMLEPDRWRPLRTKLSPVFTTGRLKEMFSLIVECAGHLEEYLKKIVEKQEPVDCVDLAAKFTTDVIGNCAFGIDMQSLSDENSEFRRMGKRIFAPTTKQLLRDYCRGFFPRLYRKFGHHLQDKELNEFFTNTIKDMIKYRKENNIFRPDFVNVLKEITEHPEKLETIDLTDSFIASQAFIFFVAGFETSSTTIGNALYELALNPDIQDKLRNEIKESFAKHGPVVTYEQLKELHYLDKVFRETLRKHAVLAMLMREVTQNYTFRNTKITIPKDTKIWIPVSGIQLDPKFYPNPEVFDPDRFNDDAVAARHPMTYLPFGDGPRNCIGLRFAHLQSKVGLITILRNYRVDVCEKTTIPYQMDKRSFLIKIKGGVILKISKAEASTS